ncbi:MAG: tetratricopeptide repeat protein [Pseudomonadota bacterium]
MWVIFAAMAAVAVVFVVLPLVREARVLSGVLIVATCLLSAGVYWQVGSPGTPSGGGQVPDVAAMVAGLAERLEERPDDVQGWKMLGRSYMQLGNYGGAIEAFSKAVELESGQDAQALVSLGEAHLSNNDQQMTPREIALFENAITVDPELPAAQFWSGIGAATRGDLELAASRWEKLLNSEPAPNPEVTQLLTQKIAEWRGVTPAPAMSAAAGSDQINLNVELSDEAKTELPDEASVFVIARDPRQPVPPIAVQRRMLSELPASLTLSDRDAMIPGRNLSAFAEVEIVARVSLSGQPVQQSGDWFGSVSASIGSGDVLDVVIDEKVQ